MRKLFCELTFKEVYTNSMYLTFFPFSQMHAISYYTGDVGREGGMEKARSDFSWCHLFPQALPGQGLSLLSRPHS